MDMELKAKIMEFMRRRDGDSNGMRFTNKDIYSAFLTFGEQDVFTALDGTIYGWALSGGIEYKNWILVNPEFDGLIDPELETIFHYDSKQDAINHGVDVSDMPDWDWNK